MEETRRWMSMAPLSPIKILEGLRGRSYDTVRRDCLALHDVEQAAQTSAGRILQASGLWVPSSLGLRTEYPEEHTHPRGSNHMHNPLRPEFSDHQHPGYFQTKKGILDIYKRLEFSELALSVAPDLFDGPGLDWSYEKRRLQLTEWRYIRRSRLIQAVGTYDAELRRDYEAQMRISYMWVPRGISEKMLLERYENCYADVETVSSYEVESAHLSFSLNPDEPHHPDLVPIMSGVVIVCADRRTYQFARRILGPFRQDLGLAICWVWGTSRSERHYEGTAFPVLANIADRFEDVNIGYPEDICLGFGNVAQWSSGRGRRVRLPRTVAESVTLDSVLKNRLLWEVGDNAGFSKKDYMTTSGNKESGTRVEKALLNLVEAEYFDAVPFARLSANRVVFDAQEIKLLEEAAKREKKKLDLDAMYYWTAKAVRYAAGLNRQSGKDLLKRHDSKKNQDHRPRRPHRQHTLIVNEVVSILVGKGFDADNGYRYLINLPDVTQIPPDAVVTGTYTRGAYVVEQFTTGGTSDTIRQEIRKALISQVEAIWEGKDRPLALLYDSRFTRRVIYEESQAVSDQYGLKLGTLIAPQRLFTVGPKVGEVTTNPLRVLFRTVLFFIEVELSAKWTKRIRQKFSTYLKWVKETNESCFVIIICGTKAAADIFYETTEREMQEAGVRLTVVITTVKEFRTKRLAGHSVLKCLNRRFHLFPNVSEAESFWK